MLKRSEEHAQQNDCMPVRQYAGVSPDHRGSQAPDGVALTGFVLSCVDAGVSLAARLLATRMSVSADWTPLTKVFC